VEKKERARGEKIATANLKGRMQKGKKKKAAGSFFGESLFDKL